MGRKLREFTKIKWTCQVEIKNKLADAKKEKPFLYPPEDICKSEIVYTDSFKQEKRNVGFAAVFKDETVCGTHPIEAEITAIHITLKKIKQKKNIIGQCGLTLKGNRIWKILTPHV